MRGLIVGLGSIGRRHARNWSTLGYGPLSVCHQVGAPQPEPLGVAVRHYDDLTRALHVEHPDVVLVTNPTSLHVAAARTAIEAGAHVLIEKPMGSSLVGVAELLDTTASRALGLSVAYNLRFHPGLARAKALVAQGAIGRVVSARAEVGEYLPDWHPWEDYRRSYSGRRDLGGGAVLTFSHELDALCWLLGAPARVTAMVAHGSSLQIDAEDVAEIVVQFASGVIGSIHLDYIRRPPRRTLELVGENGVLRWEYQRNRLEIYSVETRQWRIEEGNPTYARNQMYVDELRDFVETVRDGPVPALLDGRQGAAVLALALAALRSAADGRTLDLQSEDETTRQWLSSFNSPA